MSSFQKESILPASDPRSPFFVNVPPADAKPIDTLIQFFKSWKHFIKSLIFYLKEIAMVKEFEASLNYQLIYSVKFPGFKDLPDKFIKSIDLNSLSPSNSQSTTPVKELQRTLSSSSLATQSSSLSGQSNPNLEKRSSALKNMQNSSFLKNVSGHSRNISSGSLSKVSQHVNSSVSGLVHNMPNNHLSSGGNDFKIPPTFFPETSLFNNMPQILLKHHVSCFQAQCKLVKELNTKIIPRLETLGKNLLLKIKEIRSSLKNESFANTDVIKEVSKTGRVLDKYSNSIQRYSNLKPIIIKEDNEEEDSGQLDDPFLIKLQVDYQVKKQLLKENYTFASYVNLQNISKDLYIFVLKELKIISDKFGKLVDSESVYLTNGDPVVNIHLNLKKHVTSSHTDEWGHFVSHNSNLLNIYKDSPLGFKRETRNIRAIQLPYANSIHNKCIRYGIMYRKSKLLKNYTTLFYLLTCNYLHEFKIEHENSTHTKKKDKGKIGGFVGHDDIPIKSYNLNDYSLKTKDEKGFKFVMTRTSNPSKKFTFKCTSEESFNSWYADLYELLRFGSDHLGRFALLENKISTMENATSQSASQNKDQNLHLDKFQFTPPAEEALSGIFTPKVKTPLIQTPEDGNPFDKTFLDGMPAPSSDGLSVDPLGDSPKTTPKTTPTEEPITNPLHKEQHELYLKMQKEVLKRKEKELESLKNSSSSSTPNSNSDSDIKRHSSSESFLPNSSNVQHLISRTKNMLSRSDKPTVFSLDMNHSDLSLNDKKDDEAKASPGDIPKLFVSSDH